MPKLQSLRIPAGWEVVFNKFLEIDIKDCPADNENWIDFTEDITYLRRKSRKYNIGIDLGWYPDTDPQGAFHVKVILDEKWEKPVIEYVTRERKEVVKIIEDLLLRYCSDYNIDVDVKRYFENR
ncbi:MAG: hypothetical protein HDR11_16945 [Lachnospiraceae bacterium]|nr:hypothetical protein [Lachnospiraceae bacterium]